MPDVDLAAPTLPEALDLFENTLAGGLLHRHDFAAAYPDLDYDQVMVTLTAYPSAHIVAMIAAREDTPSAALARLADYPDLDIVCHVARNPATDEATLLRLLAHPAVRVRATVAMLTRTDAAARWDTLVADPAPAIQRCLARNPRTPVGHLVAMTGPDTAYPDALGNDALPLDVLRAHLASPAAKNGPDAWCMALHNACAHHPDADADMIAGLAAVLPASHYLWYDIVESEHLTEEIALRALSRRIGVEAASSLASWNPLPDAVAARLLRDKRKTVAEALAANPTAPSEWLLSLVDPLPAAHNNITAAALANPALPDTHLPTTGPDWVLERAMANPTPRPPALISAWLARTLEPHWRQGLMRTLLNRLDFTAAHYREAWDALSDAGHNAIHFRREMVGRPTCPPDVLEKACYDEAPLVRITARDNPATPEHAQVAAALLAS